MARIQLKCKMRPASHAPEVIHSAEANKICLKETMLPPLAKLARFLCPLLFFIPVFADTLTVNGSGTFSLEGEMDGSDQFMLSGSDSMDTITMLVTLPAELVGTA